MKMDSVKMCLYVHIYIYICMYVHVCQHCNLMMCYFSTSPLLVLLCQRVNKFMQFVYFLDRYAFTTTMWRANTYSYIHTYIQIHKPNYIFTRLTQLEHALFVRGVQTTSVRASVHPYEQLSFPVLLPDSFCSALSARVFQCLCTTRQVTVIVVFLVSIQYVWMSFVCICMYVCSYSARHAMC